MVKKTEIKYMWSTRDPPEKERYTQTNSKGIEDDISFKWKRKKVGAAILISDKIDFKSNLSAH